MSCPHGKHNWSDDLCAECGDWGAGPESNRLLKERIRTLETALKKARKVPHDDWCRSSLGRRGCNCWRGKHIDTIDKALKEEEK